MGLGVTPYWNNAALFIWKHFQLFPLVFNIAIVETCQLNSLMDQLLDIFKTEFFQIEKMCQAKY